MLNSIPESGKLLVAFSGGSDSLALLFILSAVARDRTAAVYVNHRIRGEEEISAEIMLNRKNAEWLGIRFSVLSLDEGEVEALSASDKCGTEAAARKLRYEKLENYRRLNGFDYILTAHHREDQIESMIMRLLDSAPFYSLSGIKERDGVKIRPLLRTAKSDIMELLRSEGLVWSEDSTNSDTNYKRNFIRHNIIPLISEKERVLFSKISSDVAAINERFSHSINISFSYFAEIRRDDFIASDGMAIDNAIFRVNAYFNNSERVSRSFIESIKEKAREGRGRILSSSMNFYFMKDKIRIYPAVWDFAVPYSGLSSFGPFLLSEEKEDERTLLIDESIISASAVVRSSRIGDVIELKDGRRKISELEKEYRIPSSIVLEDENGIVAVFGRIFGGRDRISRRFIGRKGTPISIKMI